MPNNRLRDAVRRAVTPLDDAGATDGQLLERFVRCRDHAAFAAIVRRHGPMVFGVCRRLLHDRHDAEDAFQATFLVLVLKASSVAPPERVGGWLHGVARQTALRAGATAARRRARERPVKNVPEPEAPTRGGWEELLPHLDREVDRLPAHYRLPVVLCDLEGKTRREAAVRLGWPEGTVAGRLARGRALLARRLRTYDPAVLAFTPRAAGPVPPGLVDSAAAVVGGCGAVSAPAAALAKGVAMTMKTLKLAAVCAAALAFAAVAGGYAVLACRPGAPGPQPVQSVAAAEGKENEGAGKKADVDKDDGTAWGDVVGGLQAGIALPDGGRQAYHVGEDVTFVVKVRNVGRAAVTMEYPSEPFQDLPTSVEDAAGRTVPVRMPLLARQYKKRLVRRTLAAGEEAELGRPTLALAAADPGDDPEKPTLTAEPGRYSIRYLGVVRVESYPDAPGLISTGKAALEVVAREQEEETAWGEVAGGLQAGVAIKGGRRAYRIGEVVPLVVPLRNVTDKAIAFDYSDGFFVENSPAVTDADGKPARLSAFPRYLGTWGLLHLSLAAGETVEFGSLDLALAPADAKDDSGKPTLFVTPGRYHVRYEMLPAFRGELDPTNAGLLSTGTIELKVK